MLVRLGHSLKSTETGPNFAWPLKFFGEAASKFWAGIIKLNAAPCKISR